MRTREERESFFVCLWKWKAVSSSVVGLLYKLPPYPSLTISAFLRPPEIAQQKIVVTGVKKIRPPPEKMIRTKNIPKNGLMFGCFFFEALLSSWRPVCYLSGTHSNDLILETFFSGKKLDYDNQRSRILIGAKCQLWYGSRALFVGKTKVCRSSNIVLPKLLFF